MAGRLDKRTRLNTLDAIRRTDRFMDRLSGQFQPPEHCCVTCACSEYNKLYEKNERRRKSLGV